MTRAWTEIFIGAVLLVALHALLIAWVIPALYEVTP